MSQKSLAYFRSHFDSNKPLPSAPLVANRVTRNDKKVLWELYAPEDWQDHDTCPHAVYDERYAWPTGLGMHALYWVLKNVPRVRTMEALGLEATARVCRSLNLSPPQGQVTYWNKGYSTTHPVGSWFRWYYPSGTTHNNHISFYSPPSGATFLRGRWSQLLDKRAKRDPFNAQVEMLRKSNPFEPLCDVDDNRIRPASESDLYDCDGIMTILDPTADRRLPAPGAHLLPKSLVVFRTAQAHAL